MFSWLYLLLVVFAGGCTYHFATGQRATLFTAMLAFVFWGYLSLQTSMTVVSGGSEITIEIVRSLRFLFGGLGVIAAFEVVMQIFGTNDAERDLSTDEMYLDR